MAQSAFAPEKNDEESKRTLFPLSLILLTLPVDTLAAVGLVVVTAMFLPLLSAVLLPCI
jgi:hypothetical protein